jgi:hypothetical protein
MGFVIQMAPRKAEGGSRTGPYSSCPTTLEPALLQIGGQRVQARGELPIADGAGVLRPGLRPGRDRAGPALPPPS